jgi:non-heme chloroperoxidase
MGLGAAITTMLPKSSKAQSAEPTKSHNVTANTITTSDGVVLYYKDWGPKNGPVVTLSHGWPLDSDSWDGQAFFLARPRPVP